MGKTSLRNRTQYELKKSKEKICFANIDITKYGQSKTKKTENKFYYSLLDKITKDLKLQIDLNVWWDRKNNIKLTPSIRFIKFLEEIALNQISDSIVIVIDEIDAVRGLSFGSSFLAVIRSIYNERGVNKIFERLTFVLLGTATPQELIKDTKQTPFNIGEPIDLKDLTLAESQKWAIHLEKNNPTYGKKILETVFEWTNGHPYLTQRLCADIDKGKANKYEGKWPVEKINNWMEQNVLLKMIQEIESDNTLQQIQRDISHAPNRERKKLLDIYQDVYISYENDKDFVKDEKVSREKEKLKILGLVREEKGYLKPRNKIYYRIFNQTWIQEQTPINTTLISVIVAVLITVIILGGIYIISSGNEEAETKFEQAKTEFNNSDSIDIQLSGLAKIFAIKEDGFTEQGIELFNNAKPEEKKKNLFNPTSPQNVATELVTVTKIIYITLDDSAFNNELLKIMSNTLAEFDEGYRIADEIGEWLNGRIAFDAKNYKEALEAYDDAIKTNSKKTNPWLYYERALVHFELGSCEKSLDDYNTTLTIKIPFETDLNFEQRISKNIHDNQDLYNCYLPIKDNYPNLKGLIPTPTSTFTPEPLAVLPTTTPTPTPTNTPIPTSTSTDIPTQTSTPTSTPTPTDTLVPTPANTSTPTPTYTPTNTPTASAPPVTGRIAIPINDGLGNYDVIIYSVPDGKELGKILGVRQPNFRTGDGRLLVNGETGPQAKGIGENVYLYDSNGQNAQVVSSSPEDSYPTWAPNGDTRIAYSNSNLVSIQTTGVEWHLFVQPGLSPVDRDEIAGNYVIEGMIFDTQQPLYPLWADDDYLLFRACDYWPSGQNGSNCGIYRTASWNTPAGDGFKVPQKVTNFDAIPTDTSGTNLIFMSRNTGNWDIYSTTVSGGPVNQLTNNPADDGLGTLSPDNQWVAFVSNRDNSQWAVWVIPIEGGEAFKLFDLPPNPWLLDPEHVWTRERISWAR